MTLEELLEKIDPTPAMKKRFDRVEMECTLEACKLIDKNDENFKKVLADVVEEKHQETFKMTQSLETVGTPGLTERFIALGFLSISTAIAVKNSKRPNGSHLSGENKEKIRRIENKLNKCNSIMDSILVRLGMAEGTDLEERLINEGRVIRVDFGDGRSEIVPTR